MLVHGLRCSKARALPAAAHCSRRKISLIRCKRFSRAWFHTARVSRAEAEQKRHVCRAGAALEVCTGFKLKPEPGPYPRSSDPTRPDPSGTVKFKARTRNLYFFFTTNSQFKKKKKREWCCISRLHAMISKQIHVKKQIHQGSASSQGKIKNTYQLWKFMNIRCSGHINSAEFLNGCSLYDKTIILPPCKLWSFSSVKAR